MAKASRSFRTGKRYTVTRVERISKSLGLSRALEYGGELAIYKVTFSNRFEDHSAAVRAEKLAEQVVRSDFSQDFEQFDPEETWVSPFALAISGGYGWDRVVLVRVEPRHSLDDILRKPGES